jgi:hypothetical protein
MQVPAPWRVPCRRRARRGSGGPRPLGRGLTRAAAAQDGGVLLHVGGRLRVGGTGPLAMGPQGAGPPTAFTEAFVLAPSASGGLRVLRQFFRLLGAALPGLC